jgi:hypothetical protein
MKVLAIMHVGLPVIVLNSSNAANNCAGLCPSTSIT